MSRRCLVEQRHSAYAQDTVVYTMCYMKLFVFSLQSRRVCTIKSKDIQIRSLSIDAITWIICPMCLTIVAKPVGHGLAEWSPGLFLRLGTLTDASKATVTKP